MLKHKKPKMTTEQFLEEVADAEFRDGENLNDPPPGMPIEDYETKKRAEDEAWEKNQGMTFGKA